LIFVMNSRSIVEETVLLLVNIAFTIFFGIRGGSCGCMILVFAWVK
jgi:hypothetical protein